MHIIIIALNREIWVDFLIFTLQIVALFCLLGLSGNSSEIQVRLG